MNIDLSSSFSTLYEKNSFSEFSKIINLKSIINKVIIINRIKRFLKNKIEKSDTKRISDILESKIVADFVDEKLEKKLITMKNHENVILLLFLYDKI